MILNTILLLKCISNNQKYGFRDIDDYWFSPPPQIGPDPFANGYGKPFSSNIYTSQPNFVNALHNPMMTGYTPIRAPYLPQAMMQYGAGGGVQNMYNGEKKEL